MIDLSADYLEEYILDMLKRDFVHVEKLSLDECINGTMGFIYWIQKRLDDYIVEFYVDPSLSSSYDWTTL